jgi:hypothetical protein
MAGVGFVPAVIDAGEPAPGRRRSAGTQTDFNLGTITLDVDGVRIRAGRGVDVTLIAAVPIVNPTCWRLIENRAMLLLDVGLVQTDLWDGD